MKRAILATLSMATIVAAAPAATADKNGVLKAVTDCRAVADSTQRLACYDAAVARLDTAAAKNDIVVLDREEVKETRKGLFGFALPKLPFFKGDDSHKEPEVVELNSVVKRAQNIGHAHWRITLENDAVWETTDPVTRHDPKPGAKIRVRQGAMTNYFLSIDGDPSVRAKRVG